MSNKNFKLILRNAKMLNGRVSERVEVTYSFFSEITLQVFGLIEAVAIITAKGQLIYTSFIICFHFHT